MPITPFHVQPALKRLYQSHVGLLIIAASLCGLGLLMMVSAGNGAFGLFAMPQLVRFLLSFCVMMVIAILPMRFFLHYAYIIYAALLLILIGVDIAGHIGMGAQRWLKIGGMNLQPSEFMKMGLILALARYFHYLHYADIKRISFLLVPLLLVLLPAFFVMRQPNLGTTLILLSIGFVLCFMAGLQWRYIIGAGFAGGAALPVLWHFMHDYQKRRVFTFLDPSQDPLGAGYNILQSMIAIGSGGFFGKGYLNGSQNQLNFLPEKHTDFVFTIFAEEFGFGGSILLLLLYGCILLIGMLTALRSRSTFGSMMAMGVTSVLFVHLMINCAMVMGMIPVVGIPLPFMSYGGSIMLSSFTGLGLLLNAYINREQLPGSRGLR